MSHKVHAFQGHPRSRSLKNHHKIQVKIMRRVYTNRVNWLTKEFSCQSQVFIFELYLPDTSINILQCHHNRDTSK